jgi:phosphoribosyl 1,2-cyclic phosphodiesterase
MKVVALSSGSDGNCFYIEKDENALLIDAGINAKKINERLSFLNLDSKKIKGIFLTHEHIDHIRGCDVFARQNNIPIYATKGTINSGNICSEKNLINEIKNDEIVSLSKFKVETFSKSHKAADPVSFSILAKKENKRVSVITDLGKTDDIVNGKINESDFIFLESNHDLKMLDDGPYPYFLKRWISGDTGHLSNNQSALSVLEHGNSRIKNIVLSHLSKHNNLPDLAVKTFKNILKERKNINAKISISLDDKPTEIFKV